MLGVTLFSVLGPILCSVPDVTLFPVLDPILCSVLGLTLFPVLGFTLFSILSLPIVFCVHRLSDATQSIETCSDRINTEIQQTQFKTH